MLQQARCCDHGRRWPTSSLMPAVNAATGQVLSTRSPVDHSHRPASCDTSLVVSGGADCGRRRWNVYDKKPERYRYAKDNRTAHLTARSDKSVAYVTNNKRLYSMFSTVEANYWQTLSIARPLCNRRATCTSTSEVICWEDQLFVPVNWLAGKIVSKMTYNVSSGTLNPTVLYF